MVPLKPMKRLQHKTRFVQEKALKIDDILFRTVMGNLERSSGYVSERAICERMIAPVPDIVTSNYPLELWSYTIFNVSEEDGLVGVADYLIAPASDIGTTFTCKKNLEVRKHPNKHNLDYICLISFGGSQPGETSKLDRVFPTRLVIT